MDKDLERKRILAIEEATLKIKTIIMNAPLDKVNKMILKEQCDAIVRSTEKKLKDLELDEKLIKTSVKALKMNFHWWYQQMIVTLEKTAKIDTTGIVKDTLKSIKNIDYKSSLGGFTITANGKDMAMDQVQVTNLRELMTIYDEGAAGRYVDYVGQIKDALVEVQNKIADGSLSTIDKLGRKKSIRNMAEIKTRYDLINEDLNKLKDKGVNFVVATSHANASERCSWWQGKIFKIDDGFDIATREMGQYKGQPKIKKEGTIDGKPYYSLKQACENGFLSFNCQHRVVAYYKGIKVPKYNLVDIKKKRALTSKQRYLENKIRKAKTRQVIAASPEEKQKAIDDSKRFQKEYEDFCKDNNVPRYDWRCRVTEVERDVSPVFEEKYKEQKQAFNNKISKDYMANIPNKWEAKPIIHTPEELLELKEKAQEIGFNQYTSFEDFDGNIELLNKTFNAAKLFFDKFPHLKGKIKLYTTKMKDDDFGETFGNTIALNTVAFRSEEELLYNLKNSEDFAKETDVDTIILHELGHAFRNHYQFSNLRIAKKITGISDTKNLMDYIKDNVSTYAGSHFKGKEIISECMVKYFKGSKNTFVLNFIEECSKIIMEGD